MFITCAYYLDYLKLRYFEKLQNTHFNLGRAGLASASEGEPVPGINVAPTDEQIAEELRELATMDNLTSIEGTKIKLSRAILERTERMKRKALKLKFPKHIVSTAAVAGSEKPPVCICFFVKFIYFIRQEGVTKLT